MIIPLLFHKWTKIQYNILFVFLTHKSQSLLYNFISDDNHLFGIKDKIKGRQVLHATGGSSSTNLANSSLDLPSGFFFHSMNFSDASMNFSMWSSFHSYQIKRSTQSVAPKTLNNMNFRESYWFVMIIWNLWASELFKPRNPIPHTCQDHPC